MPIGDSEIDLQRHFRQLAATAKGPDSGLIEVRLRLACRARRRDRLRVRLLLSGMLVAACCLIALAWSLRVSKQQIVSPSVNYAGFMALPYSQTDVPMEQAVIVRVDLQPVDLERLGLPAAYVVNRKKMRADLLIGQDGVARAVRLAE